MLRKKEKDRRAEVVRGQKNPPDQNHLRLFVIETTDDNTLVYFICDSHIELDRREELQDPSD